MKTFVIDADEFAAEMLGKLENFCGMEAEEGLVWFKAIDRETAVKELLESMKEYIENRIDTAVE